MYEVRLVIPRLSPASSSSHFRMLFMLCPPSSAASISGQSALICPAFVAGFSARRCARRLRATTIQVADFSVLCVSGKKKPLQITAQKAFFGQLFSRCNWAGQKDCKQRMEEPRGPAGSEEHSYGDLRRLATNRGGFPASRQSAMNHDVLRQTRQPGPMRRGNKDPVLEHKGFVERSGVFSLATSARSVVFAVGQNASHVRPMFDAESLRRKMSKIAVLSCYM